MSETLFDNVSTTAPPAGVPEEVASLFESLAMEVIRTGRERYSADAILHRIRWHFQIEKGRREYKCNDHWTAALARWFIARHPQFSRFFELRERRIFGTSS